MSTQTNYVGVVDPRHPGVNNQILQEAPIVAEVPESMADNDTTDIQMPLTGNSYEPPLVVNVYTHTGGDITSTAAATKAINTGDTLIIQVDTVGNGKYTEYTHTLTNLTDGAATAAQLATSINADANLKNRILAVAGLTTNAVTLFPITPRGALRVVGGTAAAVAAFPGSVADAKARTYASQTLGVAGIASGWTWSFVASTGVLTVKNETGGAINRVRILVKP